MLFSLYLDKKVERREGNLRAGKRHTVNGLEADSNPELGT